MGCGPGSNCFTSMSFPVARSGIDGRSAAESCILVPRMQSEWGWFPQGKRGGQSHSSRILGTLRLSLNPTYGIGNKWELERQLKSENSIQTL